MWFRFMILDYYYNDQGRIQDFKLGGAHLKKLRRAEGGAKNFGVFRDQYSVLIIVNLESNMWIASSPGYTVNMEKIKEI
jgi:hypothetical protein